MPNSQLPNTLGVFVVLEILVIPFVSEGSAALLRRQWSRMLAAYALSLLLGAAGLIVLGVPMLGYNLTPSVELFLLTWLRPIVSNPYFWVFLISFALVWIGGPGFIKRINLAVRRPAEPTNVKENSNHEAESVTSTFLMPAPKVRTVEEWTAAAARLRQKINQKFEFCEVILDGNKFINCTFTHVNLFYNGTLPTAFSNCDFDDDTVKHFHTQNPALAQWMEITRSLGLLKPGTKFAASPLPSDSKSLAPEALSSTEWQPLTGEQKARLIEGWRRSLSGKELQVTHNGLPDAKSLASELADVLKQSGVKLIAPVAIDLNPVPYGISIAAPGGHVDQIGVPLAIGITSIKLCQPDIVAPSNPWVCVRIGQKSRKQFPWSAE